MFSKANKKTSNQEIQGTLYLLFSFFFNFNFVLLRCFGITATLITDRTTRKFKKINQASFSITGLEQSKQNQLLDICWIFAGYFQSYVSGRATEVKFQKREGKVVKIVFILGQVKNLRSSSDQTKREGHFLSQLDIYIYIYI